jgi:hypothetical protein
MVAISPTFFSLAVTTPSIGDRSVVSVDILAAIETATCAC